MEGFYFIDPLSVATNGFDVFDQYSDALSIASLGFIKFKVTSVIVKRSGGGDQAVTGVPLKIWKDLEPRQAVPELDKIREMLHDVNAKEVQITLEPINASFHIEPMHIGTLKEEFSKVFTEFTVNLEYQNEPVKEKSEITIFLEKIDNI